MSVGFSVHAFGPLHSFNVLQAQVDKALYIAKERGETNFLPFKVYTKFWNHWFFNKTHGFGLPAPRVAG